MRKPGQFVSINGERCRVNGYHNSNCACAKCVNVWSKLYMLTPCNGGGPAGVDGEDALVDECIEKLGHHCYPEPLKK